MFCRESCLCTNVFSLWLFGATLQDVKDGNSMFDIINSLQEYIFLYRLALFLLLHGDI